MPHGMEWLRRSRFLIWQKDPQFWASVDVWCKQEHFWRGIDEERYWHGAGEEEPFSRMPGGPMILGFGRRALALA